jgi:Icc protein
MPKIIWLSDAHFLATGDAAGHDPRVRLAAAVDHVNARYGDADFAVISGDLVHDGGRADYQGFRKAVDRLNIPYFPMVGNHDTRDDFRAVLALPDDCMADYVQYCLPTDDGLILCLDTKKVGTDAGEMCAARLTWLEQTLSNAADQPVYIFMHHPPMALQLPALDTIGLENGAEFLDLIKRFPSVKHLFIGHVHRPICGTVRGIPFATMRALLHQAPAPHPAWNWDSFKAAQEAPNYGVVTIAGGDVNMQYIQFCTYERGITG